ENLVARLDAGAPRRRRFVHPRDEHLADPQLVVEPEAEPRVRRLEGDAEVRAGVALDVRFAAHVDALVHRADVLEPDRMITERVRVPEFDAKAIALHDAKIARGPVGPGGRQR